MICGRLAKGRGNPHFLAEGLVFSECFDMKAPGQIMTCPHSRPE